MENKDKKNKKIIIIILVLLIIAVIGGAIAYFTSQSKSGKQVITTGNLSIEYLNETTFNLTDIFPLTEEEVEEKASKINFTIRNNSDITEYAKIELANIILSKFKDYDFKWALYEGNTKITTGTFINEENDTILLCTNQKLDANESRNYTIYAWINETGTNQERLMDGSFKGIIQVTALDEKENTLVENILGNNNSNVIINTPTFTSGSTDMGLYVQKDDSNISSFGFPTYYYRGVVNNNYVQMGQYQNTITNTIWDADTKTSSNQVVANVRDPMIWRIVRINEDGSIKLILENNIDIMKKFNSTGTSAYVNDDSTNSNVKTELDSWYQLFIQDSNLDGIDNLIQPNSFCNDISGIDFNKSMSRGNSYTRIYTNKDPIFICNNGSIISNSKIGLITADEAMFAGMLTNNSDKAITSYLNNNTSFWTMTPFDSDRPFYIEMVTRALDLNFASNVVAAARPVINIKGDTIVSSGKGTKDSPYVIE